MAELLLPNGSMQPVEPRVSGHWTISELQSLVRGDLAVQRATNGRLLVTNNQAQLDTQRLRINLRASQLWTEPGFLRGNVVVVRSSGELPNIPISDPSAHDLVTNEQLLAAMVALRDEFSTEFSTVVPLSGATMEGVLVLADDPTRFFHPQTAATRNYVDEHINDLSNTINTDLAEFAQRVELDQYLPLDGGTMTGSLSLHNDPINSLDAATKNYVDNSISALKFAIHNDMEEVKQKIHDDTLGMLMLVPLRQDVTREIADAITQLKKDLGLAG